MPRLLRRLAHISFASLLTLSPMPAQHQDCLHGKVEVEGADFPFLLLPPAKIEAGKKYPLVLFLHGAGERGSDNRAQWKHFPERMASAEYRQKYPCFVLAPQCPEDQTWVEVNWSDEKSTPNADQPTPSMRAAIQALKEVVHSHPVDRDRIHLTGLSMGGYGTWDLAMRHANWFANAVAVCGGGDEKSISRLAGLPIQAWHGSSDGVVRPARSRVMVEAAKKLKLNVEYFELEGIGHDSWVDAYGPKGCLDWLFAGDRDPQLRQKEAARILAQSIHKKERIAFLGDSITQSGNELGGYVDQIRQILEIHMPTSTVIPAGISGHKVPDLLERVQRDVIDQKATLVFVYIGINDVWHSQMGSGTPAEEYEGGLHKLIQSLKKSGADVVLATPSVIGEGPIGTNELDTPLQLYAAISRRVAAKEGVALCDLNRAFEANLSIFRTQRNDSEPESEQAEGEWPSGVLTTDGVHLNRAGNTLVAIEAAHALIRAVQRR